MEVQNLEGIVKGLLFFTGNVVAVGVYVCGMIKYVQRKDARESRNITESTYELKTR